MHMRRSGTFEIAMKIDALRRRAASMPFWLRWTLVSLAGPPIMGFLFWYMKWWLTLFGVWPGIEFLPRT